MTYCVLDLDLNAKLKGTHAEKGGQYDPIFILNIGNLKGTCILMRYYIFDIGGGETESSKKLKVRTDMTTKKKSRTKYFILAPPSPP